MEIISAVFSGPMISEEFGKLPAVKYQVLFNR